MRPDPSPPEPTVPEAFEPYLLEHSTVAAVVLVSPQGEIVAANTRMRDLLFGADPASGRGRRFAELLGDAGSKAAWEHALRSLQPMPLAIKVEPLDGRPIMLRGDIRLVPGVEPARAQRQCVFVESADEQLKALVRQSARMEALGNLTAGIAHDFNNLLTVLVGNLYLAVEDVRDQPKLLEKLKSARDAGKRGADLIRQLLTFARREQREDEVIDPCKTIDTVIPLLRRALGSRIKLEMQIEPNVGTINANAAQLESVVVNLAINARDAIAKKGVVIIRLAPVELAPAEAGRRGLEKAGTYVELSVRDDGCGIPPAALGRIFEPFFSTKADRGGTGLGLSMVRGFADACGGCVVAQSTVDVGTTVTLLLPRVGGEAAEAHDKTMPLSTLPTGVESIVVLAPEEGLRATMCQILEVLGYKVSFAGDANELVRRAGETAAQLVIADLPGRAEAAFADAVASLRGALLNVGLIVTTDVPPKPGVTRSDVTILLKPFSLADLATATRRTLDARDRSA